MAASDAGCGSSSAGARHSAAAITTSSSAKAGCGSSRAWWRPSIDRDLPAKLSRAALPSSIFCWAAGSRPDRVRSFAVARGERAALFVFDEELGLLIARAKALGIDIEAMRDANKLFIEQMDAAEL